MSGTAATAAGTTVTLDALTDLSGVVTTPGPTQSSINIAGATNANRTIFWISAVSGSGGATPQVTVDTAPTGLTTNAWKIGGRYLWPSGATANVIEGGLRAGDVVQFNNTPATKTATYFTARVAGDTTGGFVTLQGKTGVMPVLEITNTATPITGNSITNYLIQNLVIQQDGASGNLVQTPGAGWTYYNVKFTHSGGGSGIGINTAGVCKVINCEFNGIGGDCIATSQGISVTGTYFHDSTANGVTCSAAGPPCTFAGNVFDTLTSSGINLSGASSSQAHVTTIYGNTFYNNGVAGLTVADADTVVILLNNVFQNDGTHANVVWTAGTAELVGWHGYNDFYASGGTNLTGLTPNSTEVTTNPLMINPASANFAITNTSPAAATGFPGVPLGSSSTGYKDMGAIQRQAGASGGFIIGS